MSEKTCVVRFPGTDYPPLELKAGDKLSEHLTAQNSPVLFGCRTGICGTCLVLVEGDIPPPGEDEREILYVMEMENTPARLACMVELTGDINLVFVEEQM
ncbi:MAG TPA: (2Fe-2S)-binding protein [Oscillatoriaceae cyanobacterium M33_DOE_052]|uniref:(2Fe-2S)-binding protein n=1 Tax=Planktothricoides sp. SpSt-374 TaxID=2282167 RepID=A0A7C3VGI8_9CYAN|nr:(2Fe-2S)-binding protein [Oscillatoriaceae cyanobacterium M33_DOE_052]